MLPYYMRLCKLRLKTFGEGSHSPVETMLTWLRDDEFGETQLLDEDIPFIQDELDNVMTTMYLIIEGTRNEPEYLKPAKDKLGKSLWSTRFLILTIHSTIKSYSSRLFYHNHCETSMG